MGDILEKNSIQSLDANTKKQFEGEKEDIPVALTNRCAEEGKRHSILIPRYQVIEQIAKKNKWSINETINYAISLFLFLIDTDSQENFVVFESNPLRTIRDYAARNNLEDGEVLRKAVDVYSRFIKEGIIQKVSQENESIQTGEASLQSLLADTLKRDLAL